MTGHDDVVIADGLRQEVVGLALVGELDDLLRAAEVGLRLVAHQLAFGNEVALEVAREFENGDGAFLHKASDARADARLEVGVKFVTLHHVEGDGAMGEEYLTCLRVDAGGVGLKA